MDRVEKTVYQANGSIWVSSFTPRIVDAFDSPLELCRHWSSLILSIPMPFPGRRNLEGYLFAFESKRQTVSVKGR
jgi:hypothetical protein